MIRNPRMPCQKENRHLFSRGAPHWKIEGVTFLQKEIWVDRSSDGAIRSPPWASSSPKKVRKDGRGQERAIGGRGQKYWPSNVGTVAPSPALPSAYCSLSILLNAKFAILCRVNTDGSRHGLVNMARRLLFSSKILNSNLMDEENSRL